MNMTDLLKREKMEDKEILKNKINQIIHLFGLSIGFGGIIGALLFIGRNLL